MDKLLILGLAKEEVTQKEIECFKSEDDYIKRTILLHEEAKHPSTKERYWELLGKIYGYTKDIVEIEGIKPTNITNIIRTKGDRIPEQAPNTPQHMV